MKSLKKWFLNNLGLKVLSLILAIILWFYIGGELGQGRNIQERVVRGIPVKVLEPLSGLGQHPFQIKIVPERIDLVLRGPKVDIDRLAPGELVAFVDISNLEVDRRYQLPVRVILPEDIESIPKVPSCEVILISKGAID